MRATVADHAGTGSRRAWALGLFFPELLALPLLALAIAAQPLLRGDLIGRGEIAHEYSLYAFVGREIRAGRLPLWNPYTVSGNPGLADPASNIFYPFTIPLLMLLSVAATLNALTIIHMVLAGAFMHLYLGSLRLSRSARFAGALVYMLSGVAAWRILSGDVPRLATYACVPLLFYLIEEIARGRRRTGAALLGGVVIACPLFAGEPQNFVYLSVAIATYAGFRLRALARGRDAGASVHGRALLLAALGQRMRWEPLYISKLNTALQIALVAVVLARLGLAINDFGLGLVLTYAVGATTVISGAVYLVRWAGALAGVETEP